jgi:NADPH:quinone reductase-like Zn-dependent oxidoreductase
MANPTTTKAWVVTGISNNDFGGLEKRQNEPVPQLKEHDVLVRIEAVSLNYRDLAIPRVRVKDLIKIPIG